MPTSHLMGAGGIWGCEEGGGNQARIMRAPANNPGKNRKKSMIAVAHEEVFVHE
jgi:hypothetical protein